MGINMKQPINLTLPEWAFLDGNSHLGNSLESRTVIMHVRTNTVLEVLALDDTEVQLKADVTKAKFHYSNSLGVIEQHIMIVHYTLASDFEIGLIVQKAINFYCKYLDWEDKNILNDTSKHN
jgi:hypothetical protein